MQIFAERLRAGITHRFVEPGDAHSDLAVFFVLSAFGLTIGFKPPPLIEMEEGAADMMQRQAFVQRPRPQGERIEPRQGLALRRVGGEKAPRASDV